MQVFHGARPQLLCTGNGKCQLREMFLGFVATVAVGLESKTRPNQERDFAIALRASRTSVDHLRSHQHSTTSRYLAFMTMLRHNGLWKSSITLDLDDFYHSMRCDAHAIEVTLRDSWPCFCIPIKFLRLCPFPAVHHHAIIWTARDLEVGLPRRALWVCPREAEGCIEPLDYYSGACGGFDSRSAR